MTPVNSISTVHVCTDCVPFTLIFAEYIKFMCASVCPENGILINVVRIGATSTGVVLRKP